MKILFIGHSASRTGAPISLLRIIRWLKENKNITPCILLADDGPLVSDYQQLGETYICQNLRWFIQQVNSKSNLKEWILFKLINQFKLQNFILSQELKKAYQNHQFDAIFCNTSTNGLLLEYLSFIEAPIITRIAEMKDSVKSCDIYQKFEYVKQKTNLFVAVSEAVKSDLINCFNIDKDKIAVIHGAIEPGTAISEIDLRQQLGLPSHTLIVGGSGKGLLRKGFDLFVHLASLLRDKQDIAFVWLGGERDRIFKNCWADIKKSHLENKFFFLNHQPNPEAYYKNFDIFFVSSREDPFPLSGIENGILGHPVLAFKEAGGMEELLADTDMLFPYLDLLTLSTKINEYYHNRNLLIEDGKIVKQRIMENYTIEKSGEKFYQAILSLVSH